MVIQKLVDMNLEQLTTALKDSLPTHEHAVITSLVYVRKTEEYQEQLSKEEYAAMIHYHDHILAEHGLKYDRVLYRLI